MGGGGELSQLDNYVALTEDNQIVHLKPLNIFYVTTNNTGTTINKRTDSSSEIVTLNNGKNKLTNWNYGFYFNALSMKQPQITSFDLSKFNTSNVTDMNKMFSYCKSLTSLNLSNFDTSNVTSMGHMFYGCSGLTSLDLSSFDISNVTDMEYMFQNCSGLTSLNLSNFDTSKVTSMRSMFHNCSGLTSLDLSSFDISNVTVMEYMFQNCSSLTSLNLSNFDTSKVTSMNSMFGSCNKLTYIKCKQTFKEWCITNQDTIKLPTAMRNDDSGHWEIVQ